MEKAMSPHSSTLACKIPWMEEPGRLQSMRSLRVGHDWVTSLSTEWLPFHFSLSCIGEGNGNLFQCSFLEISGTEEPGGPLSMGSHRVGHYWSDLAAAAAYLKSVWRCQIGTWMFCLKLKREVRAEHRDLVLNEVNWENCIHREKKRARQSPVLIPLAFR